MRVFGALLVVFGLLVAGVTAFVCVLAYRDLQGQPNAGHVLVPFTLGALVFFGGALAAAVAGVVVLARAKRRNPGNR